MGFPGPLGGSRTKIPGDAVEETELACAGGEEQLRLLPCLWAGISEG
jgi:hypothetical protein